MCDKCGTVLDMAIREGLPEELAFKRYLDTMEQQWNVWEKPISGRENSQGQCPEVRMSLYT